jgi:hypothetical protein
VSGLHTNSDPTARAKKGGCTVAATLLLVACSTVQQPPPSSTQQSSPAALDTSLSDITPSIEIVNKEVLSDKTLSPVKPKATVQKSRNDAPASYETEATKSNVHIPPNTPKTSQPKTPKATTPPTIDLPEPVIVDKITRTGKLENPQLTEVSGMTASRKSPGVLYAINDSGNSATLYAFSEKGQHISKWAIKARNRDWEDLDSVEIDNQSYILIGDTGDNLRIHRNSTFYLIAEPLPNQGPDEFLTPYMTIDFVYEDGPRNVEAFAVHEMTIYLISKEPVSPSGVTASRLYALQIPLTQPLNALTAAFITELPVPQTNLESMLAASFAGIDLGHITAMDMTASGHAAYLLTYREVHKIERSSDESWSAAFQSRGIRIHTHNLEQAEALAISPGRSVFVTSENRGAPLWSIPIRAAP